ncbi:hypothetical protein [Nostoc sp.]
MPIQYLDETCGNDYQILDFVKPNSENAGGKTLDCFQHPNTL